MMDVKMQTGGGEITLYIGGIVHEHKEKNLMRYEIRAYVGEKAKMMRDASTQNFSELSEVDRITFNGLVPGLLNAIAADWYLERLKKEIDKRGTTVFGLTQILDKNDNHFSEIETMVQEWRREMKEDDGE